MTDITQAKDIGKTLQLTCYLYEGVFTRKDVIDDAGVHKYGGTYASEVSEGDIVQIYHGSSAGDGFIVAAHDADSTVEVTSASAGYIGKVITTPSGRIPRVSADGGTYTASQRSEYMRFATVEFYGFTAVREFVMQEANNAGDAVGWDTSEEKMSSAVAQLPYMLLEAALADETHSVMM